MTYSSRRPSTTGTGKTPPPPKRGPDPRPHDLNGPTRRDEPIRQPRYWFEPLSDDGAPCRSTFEARHWRDLDMEPIPAPALPAVTSREIELMTLCALAAIAAAGTAFWLYGALPVLTECRP